MLKKLTSIEAVNSFARFWEKYFPEQNTLERQEVLQKLDDSSRGQPNTAAADEQMAKYQDDVALVYGAYESAQCQIATVRHLIRLATELADGITVVSLGCGPASYELWLASQTAKTQFVLADHSAGMLARAAQIATAIGVNDRVRIIQGDAGQKLPILDRSAQLTMCLNSMHWSANWRDWITQMARVSAPGAVVLLTVSLMAPRSNIMPEALAEAMNRFFEHDNAGMLLPPVSIGGQQAISTRFFAVAHKANRRETRRKKKRR